MYTKNIPMTFDAVFITHDGKVIEPKPPQPDEPLDTPEMIKYCDDYPDWSLTLINFFHKLDPDLVHHLYFNPDIAQSECGTDLDVSWR